MAESLFRRVVVPVANREDAAATAAALAPRVGAVGGSVVAVHVVEKAGGAPDKASVEQREQRAEELFAIVTDGLPDAGVDLETRILYGTDVAATIIDAARDEDAGAIVFTPRGSSRWVKLLTGDVTNRLVEGSDRPVVVLPDEEVADSESEEVSES